MGILSRIFSLFNTPDQKQPTPDINIQLQIHSIKKIEGEKGYEPGRKIHAFEYGLLEIRFDRDITLNGRICIFSGKERLFTFTVFAKQGDYDILKQAFVAVIEFLESDRSIKNLPDNNILKGHINH